MVSLFQINCYNALVGWREFSGEKKQNKIGKRKVPLRNKGSSYFFGPAANLVVEVDADKDKEEATAEEDGSSHGG